MDLPKLNYTLSNVNNLLGSALGAVQDKQNGASAGESIMNFGLNLTNGAIRNEVAYDMRKHYGTNMGFLVNNMAGYGSAEANQRGMTGLLGASLFNAVVSNPWSFGGCCGGFVAPPPVMPMPMFGGGYCGGGFFGGGTYLSPGILGGVVGGVPLPSSLATPYFGSGFSVFSTRGFFC